MKNLFQRIAITSVLGTAIAINTPAIVPPVHAASVSEAGQFLKENWRWIVSNLWTPYTKQVYMTSLSPQETQAVIREFNANAYGELKARCVNKIADGYLGSNGWSLKYTANRWLLVPIRVENGQAHCYMRLERKTADEFIRRRGW